MSELRAPAFGKAKWEHFPHAADVGVRGFGVTAAEAFEQAAQALTAVVTHAAVEPKVRVEVSCEAPDLELLFVEWLNAIIYEMAVRKMLFSRFAVTIEGGQLKGVLWGEPVEVARHAPACEPKGATYTALKVATEIFDADVAKIYGLSENDVVVTIHCGSRGLGHQIGTEFLKEMAVSAKAMGITLPDRELACAPINSEVGQRYLGAMRAAINCALANREILGHFSRRVFEHFFPGRDLSLLFDVSHNTCKVEPHTVDGKRRQLFVHRKGATRSFGPGHDSLPAKLRPVGQPVLIGGSMGTASYILVGEASAEQKSFSSACHGAGRAMSRHAALKQWSGRKIQDDLAAQGILTEAHPHAALPRRRPAPTKTSARSLLWPSKPDSPAAWPVCVR